jgi:hypothetical protein
LLQRDHIVVHSRRLSSSQYAPCEATDFFTSLTQNVIKLLNIFLPKN